MTKKKKYLLWIAGSLGHFLVMAVTLALSFSMGMHRFDHGGEAGLLEAFASTATEVLMFPFFQLWTPWASKNLPNMLENTLFLGNSVLWGYCFYRVCFFFSNKKARRDRA